MAVDEQYPELTPTRRHPLDFPTQYRELLHAGELVRVRTPVGDPAWFATRYDDVRAILSHPAMGRSHPDPARAPRFSASPMQGGPIGTVESERGEHRRMRRALGGAFSATRAEAMRTQVQRIVSELLDRMAQGGSPVDLHDALSFPLPAQVICALLGVPYEDRDRFRAWSTGATSMVDRELAANSMTALRSYMEELIERKRSEPGDDLITDLVAPEGEARLSPDEAVFLAGVLLIAGHETTVARIDAGVLLLLTHASEKAALAARPELARSAVEEILRMSMASTGVTMRYAQADVEIRGSTIRAGELVLVSTAAANRDPRVFSDPDSFDIRRDPNPQIAFAYGPHHCLGAPLARVELECVFGSLLQRFPTLELAVPLEGLQLRDDVLVGGVTALPVVW